MRKNYPHQAYVDKVAATAPPLTPEQRDRIASIIRHNVVRAELPPVNDDFDALEEVAGSE